MARFAYVGIDANGQQVKGELQAGTKNEVIGMLRKKKVRATSIKAKQGGLSIPKFGGGVKLADISRFTRQLAAMTSSGLPLVQCLDILVSQTENKGFSQKIQQISSDIQVGSTLAEALGKHPQVFNALYCNMVAAGEASGNLDGVLNRVAEYGEKSEQLKRKIVGALTYPAIVAVAAVGISAVMLIFVIPIFAKMFSDLGGKLPLPTQIVMDISNLIRHGLPFMIIGGVGAAIGLTTYYRTDTGRYNIDYLRLIIPIIGDLERKTAISRFSQTLSTLLTSGVTILEALRITAKTAGNRVLEKGLERTLQKISGGLSIADPLRETGLFPPMVTQMIAVGEKTGDLAGMLGKISEFYSEEVDAAVSALTAIIEPIMIILMGGLVGGMLIAMYLPIFDMMGAIN
jgi:type IV pilus assembly protein PilC